MTGNAQKEHFDKVIQFLSIVIIDLPRLIIDISNYSPIVRYKYTHSEKIIYY